jgi:hypothetical protein
MKQYGKISRESVLSAIAKGAKTVSAVAVAHGYGKPVSGAVTAKIRTIVPDVADRLAGKVQEPVVVVAQRKKPYTGEVYGKVFEAAVEAGNAQGALVRKDLVSVVARKTSLSETQVSYALQVFTTPKHQSNQNRSRNASEERGHVLLVPVAELVEG